MSTDTPSTDTADVSSAASLATLVHRRQNLQILATFAALVALVLLLNLTPVPGWVCSFIELEPDVPADLLGEAYWDDCFGGPLGDFAAGSLPRPEHLSYAPEADQFLAELEKLAAQEGAIEAAEAEPRQLPSRAKRSLRRFALVTRPLCPADQSATARTPRYLAASKAVRPERLPYRAARRTPPRQHLRKLPR